MIGDFVDAVVGDVAHRNAAASRGFKVDIVESDAIANDHLAVGQAFDHRPGDRSPLHQQHIGISGPFDHVLFRLALQSGELTPGILDDAFLGLNVRELKIGDHKVGSVLQLDLRQCRCPLVDVVPLFNCRIALILPVFGRSIA